MHRRAILQACGGAAALALGFSRLGGPLAGAQEGKGLASLGLPEVTITVTETGYEVAPAEISAGWTLVTLDNQSPGANSADIMLLPPGETLESLLEALAATMAAPAAAPPAWIYQATFAGAPWAPAGASGQAVVLLSAGEWVVFSPAPLTPVTLIVTAKDDAPDTPPGLRVDREVSMQEYAFVGFEEPLSAGRQVWQVSNIGQQPHFFTIAPVPSGTTQEQFMDSLMAMMSGTPEAGGPAPTDTVTLGGCSTISHGQSLYLALDLAAGAYGAVCFFPEPESGAPHLLMGMAQVFAVA